MTLQMNEKVRTSSQDGAIGKHSSPPHITTSKLQLNYRTTVIRIIRNWAECKSYNYRIKEETTSCLEGGVEMQNRLVPHSDKNQDGYLRSEGSQPKIRPQPRVPLPVREVTLTSGCKNQWELRL